MMNTVTIPRAEYEALLASREELDDLRSYDNAMAALARGDEELLPDAMVGRLLAGEPALKVWREHRGLSQAELSRRSGVNRVQILDIEAGRNAGSVATLKKLAQALGLSVDDLV
jgi:mRNA interferase RelE/StbE